MSSLSNKKIKNIILNSTVTCITNVYRRINKYHWYKRMLIMYTFKGCSTVQKIVIEIGMEQTRLFQCNRFHYADFRDWNRDWIFRTSSARSKKFWLKSARKSIIERTRLFLCNRFHCAENRQSDPSRFFSGSGWILWIFISRACCAWRPVHAGCWDSHNKRSMCSSCIHIFDIVIYTSISFVC